MYTERYFVRHVREVLDNYLATELEDYDPDFHDFNYRPGDIDDLRVDDLFDLLIRVLHGYRFGTYVRRELNLAENEL